MFIYNHFNKQIIWFLIGFVLFVTTYKTRFKYIFQAKYILYFINILMLIYVLIFSKSTNGIKAWINLGPLSIQPSEFIKITFPLCTIKLIKDKK